METGLATWHGELAARAPETESTGVTAAAIRIVRPTETNVLWSCNTGMCRKGLVAGAFRRQNSCLKAEINRSPSGLP